MYPRPLCTSMQCPRMNHEVWGGETPQQGMYIMSLIPSTITIYDTNEGFYAPVPEHHITFSPAGVCTNHN